MESALKLRKNNVPRVTFWTLEQYVSLFDITENLGHNISLTVFLQSMIPRDIYPTPPTPGSPTRACCEEQGPSIMI